MLSNVLSDWQCSRFHLRSRCDLGLQRPKNIEIEVLFPIHNVHNKLVLKSEVKANEIKQGGRGEISIGGAQQKLDKSSFIFPNFSLMSNNTFKISANDALTWLLFYFWKTVHIACIYKNSLE